MSTSKTWFKAWMGSIQPVEVIAETTEFLTLANHPNRREKKATDFASYHLTREEAKAALVKKAEAKVAAAKASLEYSQRELAKALAL